MFGEVFSQNIALLGAIVSLRPKLDNSQTRPFGINICDLKVREEMLINWVCRWKEPGDPDCSSRKVKCGSVRYAGVQDWDSEG